MADNENFGIVALTLKEVKAKIASLDVGQTWEPFPELAHPLRGIGNATITRQSSSPYRDDAYTMAATLDWAGNAGGVTVQVQTNDYRVVALIAHTLVGFFKKEEKP